MKLIKANVDYVDGYLRRGHLEVSVEDDVADKVSQMSMEDKKEWLRDNGGIIIDDYELNDFGDLEDVTIT